MSCIYNKKPSDRHCEFCLEVCDERSPKDSGNMRYTLFYTSYYGKKRFDDSWFPSKEQIHFKTLKEAEDYLAIMAKEDKAYIYDNVTKKVVK